MELRRMVIKNDIDYSPIKSSFAVDLLKRMMETDPLKRINLESIIKHPWTTQGGLKDFDVENIQNFKYGENGFGNIDRLIQF